MNIEVLERFVPSVDGKHILKGKVYVPECEIKGLFHIVHGMTEHINRYDSFMKSMAEEGYITFGYNHLGHGYTVTDDSELGYICEDNGWDYLVNDVKNYADAIRDEFGPKLPYYLMGHSMGSFIVRCATYRNIKPEKLIIMGTGGPNPLSGIGLVVVNIVKKVKGGKYISKLVYDLAFGSYNKKFGEKGGVNWLTKDDEIVSAYLADKYCTFKFTTSAMKDLITLQSKANSKEWFRNISDSFPILLLSGEDDPVGEYSKGVKKVYQNLKSNGKDVRIKLYKNCRHEILNDTCKNDVINDIKSFLE